jgi:hypothetical protein
MKTCVPCGRGFHKECLKGCKNDPCHVQSVVEEGTLELTNQSSSSVAEGPKARKKGSIREGLKDPQSTGRKRAARLYPSRLQTAQCEWKQGSKNCGGGRYPIIGCISGSQKARHHGPVKNTTRNHQGNVHRICSPGATIIGTNSTT